tara:strand:- start:5 stop:208 length:204 start_codon:yes stop_codon:yes gene_type:complete
MKDVPKNIAGEAAMAMNSGLKIGHTTLQQVSPTSCEVTLGMMNIWIKRNTEEYAIAAPVKLELSGRI